MLPDGKILYQSILPTQFQNKEVRVISWDFTSSIVLIGSMYKEILVYDMNGTLMHNIPLMKSGGLFCTKLLALPCGVEHSTEFIAFCTGADSSIKQSELISWLVDVDDQVSTGGFTESSRSVVPVCCAEDAIWLGQRELLLVVSFASDHFAAVNTFARKGRSWELTHNLSDKPSVFAGRGPLITGTEMLASDSSGSTWMEFWRAAIKAKAMPIIQISVPIGEM